MMNEDDLPTEDMDAMSQGAEGDPGSGGDNPAPAEGELNQEERDTLVELTNIAMGASASTLSVLLDRDFEFQPQELVEHPSLGEFPEPFPSEEKVLVFTQYSIGLNRSSIYILRAEDAKQIASTVMGEEEVDLTAPLTQIEKDGLAEAMSQIFNSCASALSSMISAPIDMSPPMIMAYSPDNLTGLLPALSSQPFVSIGYLFKAETGDTLDMIELQSLDDVKGQVGEMLAVQPEEKDRVIQSVKASSGNVGMAQDDMFAPQAAAQQRPQPAASAMGGMGPGGGGKGMDNPFGSGMGGSSSFMHADPVTVQPVQFPAMDNQPAFLGEQNKNLELVMDVSLSLTVELGKTEISIKEVLELTRGSVIELDRIAGEPVDLLANGKLIAKGEVVVIEDNFGLRITSIVSPADRLRGL